MIKKHFRAFYLCLWLIAVAGTARVQAAEPLHRFTAPAAWIKAAQPNYAAPDPAGGTAGGSWVLLLDRQIEITAKGDNAYEHLAIKVLNTDGAAEYSQLNISVDPTFQTLDIHQLRVVRDGKIVEQNSSARITPLPEETELQNRIYNGRYNINILLADVKAGDVVEYAYTLHSQEKLFPGHFATRLVVGWNSPTHWQRIRLRYPLDRQIRLRLSNGAAAPAPQTIGNAREVELQWNALPAIPAEWDTPGWYTQWPYLEVSDLQDWSQAAQLTQALFASANKPSARVQPIAESIRTAGGTPVEQALRALQYVQEQIHYTSIAIGRGTHRPTNPDTVLKQRFGDCKDKSLLLTALLKQLGIDAQPALVHSGRGKALNTALPTPYAFDHTIVQANIANQTYWMDGTLSTQYSPLSPSSRLSFAYALPIESTAKTLTPIPQAKAEWRDKDILLDLDLTAGVDKPAVLKIVTVYQGDTADVMRRVLSRGSAEQRASDYINYIARYYPGVKADGPIAVADDKDKNQVVINERYILERGFIPDDKGAKALTLHANELYSYAEPLETSVRTTPLDIEYPVRIRQNILVHLPESWPVKPEEASVSNPAFNFRYKIQYTKRKLQLSYEYEALADHVQPAALKRYLTDRARFYGNLGYTLTKNAPHSATSAGLAIAPTPLLVMLFSLVACVWAAIRWGYRYDPQLGSIPPDAPSGIGGWLIIPALSVIACPFIALYGAAQMTQFADASVWYGLPKIVSDGYSAWIQPAYLLLIALSNVLLVGFTLLAVLFVKKRTSVPMLFIIAYWFSVMFGFTVDTFLFSSGLNDDTSLTKIGAETVRDTIFAAVWTSYLLKSKRVKATFVNRLAVTASPPAITAPA